MSKTQDRAELRAAEGRLWARGIEAIRASLRWQRVIKLLLIIGGTLLSGLGSAMDGAILSSGGDGLITLKGLLVAGGLFAVAVGGTLLLFVDEHFPALLQEARAVVTKAREYLDERDAKEQQLVDFEALDRRRRALIAAADLMREVVEQSLVRADATVDDAAQIMLNTAIASIQTAIGLEPGELWSISVFRVVGDGADAMLSRIAVSRGDRRSEEAPARTWRRNEGLVGAVWQSDRDSVIEDAHDPRVAADYPVPEEKARSYDSDRYRSMAAIPIRVGGTQAVWGVVAASSNVPNRFRRDPTNERAQNVDTVRTIARMIALLAAGFSRR